MHFQALWSLCFRQNQKGKSVKWPNKSATKLGERLFMDVTLPMAVSLEGKKHWLLVVDDCSNYAWRYFLKKKSEFPIKNKWISGRVEGKTANHCQKTHDSNAGENLAFETIYKQEGDGITFKYTVPGAPQ